MDFEHHSPHNPGHGIGQTGVGGVIPSDVLQMANGCIEAAPTGCVDITETDTATTFEDPTRRRSLRDLSCPRFGHAGTVAVTPPVVTLDM
jgi:hypothetical protein